MSKLNRDDINLIAGMALKYFPELVLEMGNMFKNSTTVDDAIAALEEAKTKTAADYLAEAKAELAGTPVVDMPLDPSKDLPPPPAT